MLKCKVLIVCVLSVVNVFAQSEFKAPKSRKAPKGISFKVDAVEKASAPLNVMTAQNAFEFQLGKKISFFPDDLKNTTVVPTWNNAFIMAIHTSFDEHRPLSLSPDAIWLTICQGVSIHINQHFDELEAFIFKAEKPDKFVVRNDDLPNGSVHWADLLHAFSDSTTKYVNDDYYAFFVPEFSTTTDIITTSYEITMLEGFSQAFEYFGDSGCGIPTITLQGTKKDWQAILDRLTQIEALGLGTWAKELRGVLQKFVDVYDRKVDLDFWQSIYKEHSEYNASYVSGWFIKLFPYLCSTGEMEDAEDPEGIYYSRAPKLYVQNTFIEGEDYLISRLQVEDFPSGIAEITVHWDDYGTKREMKVHAGFYGIKQYKDMTLEPAIAWAVRDITGEDVEHEYEWVDVETEHRKVYWSPHAMEELLDSAIYDPKKFRNSTDSYVMVKIQILHHFSKLSNFSVKDLEGKSFDVVISSTGRCLEVRTPESTDDEEANEISVDPLLLQEIENAVRSLPQTWLPAHADYRQFIEDFDTENDTGEIVPIACNSLVRIMF